MTDPSNEPIQVDKPVTQNAIKQASSTSGFKSMNSTPNIKQETPSSPKSESTQSNSGSNTKSPSSTTPSSKDTASSNTVTPNSNNSSNNNNNNSPNNGNASQTSGGSTTPSNTTVCQNCQTSTTPLWRRDESGQILCNACGLFLKLHGRPRPISLKTNVIKPRNRTRNNNSHSKRKQTQSPLHLANTVSPSFSAISPHMLPHNSPLGIIRSIPHDVDLQMSLNSSKPNLNVQMMHSSNGSSNKNNAQNNKKSNVAPTTPSSIFSIPSNGNNNHNGASSNGNNNNEHHHSIYNNDAKSGASNQTGTKTSDFNHALPALSVMSSSSQSSYQKQQILPKIPLQHNKQKKSQSPTSQSQQLAHNSGNFLKPVTSSTGTPAFSATTPQLPAIGCSPNHHPTSEDKLPALPALSSLTAAVGIELNNNNNKKNSDAASQILTPQSRPQSPSQSNLHLPSRFDRREPMSEQLRPRMDDDSLDKIPPLKQVMVDWLGTSNPSSYRSSPPTSQPHNIQGRNYQQNDMYHSSSGILSRSYNSGTRSSLFKVGDHVGSGDDSINLKTRVSELELVNDLLRSRVSQLESSESRIRESEILLRKRVFDLENRLICLQSDYEREIFSYKQTIGHLENSLASISTAQHQQQQQQQQNPKPPSRPSSETSYRKPYKRRTKESPSAGTNSMGTDEEMNGSKNTKRSFSVRSVISSLNKPDRVRSLSPPNIKDLSLNKEYSNSSSNSASSTPTLSFTSVPTSSANTPNLNSNGNNQRSSSNGITSSSSNSSSTSTLNTSPKSENILLPPLNISASPNNNSIHSKGLANILNGEAKDSNNNNNNKNNNETNNGVETGKDVINDEIMNDDYPSKKARISSLVQ